MRRSSGCGDRIQSEIVLTGERAATQVPWNTQRTSAERAFIQPSAAFAALDEQALERTTPLSRNNRDSALLRRVRTLVKNEAKSQSGDDKDGTIGAATTEI